MLSIFLRLPSPITAPKCPMFFNKCLVLQHLHVDQSDDVEKHVEEVKMPVSDTAVSMAATWGRKKAVSDAAVSMTATYYSSPA